ncbi:MAG: hypothetical protein CVT84_09050, partial [Alphaproteobacteria bacterium HGW-Alphaproteobacteria-6]
MTRSRPRWRSPRRPVAPDTGKTGTRPAEPPALPAPPRIALTGATGFVGGHLLKLLADPDASAAVRALARPRAGRQPGQHAALAWVTGDLDQPAALADLCAGSDVVIHLAGATKALHGTGYHAVNAAATARLVRAAAEAGVRHVIHLSSLAATRPGVSDYAASKAAGEVAARAAAAGMALSILRAPAVLGPGDGATRPLFAMLARGWLVVPGGGARQARFSAIDVGDLCRLIAGIARAGAGPGEVRVIDPYGWQSLGWDDLAA